LDPKKLPETDDQWVDAFRSGEQTDSKGRKKLWTTADLEDIAAKYNESAAEGNANRRLAPVVIGHPTEDTAPAFGWIHAAKVVGDMLRLKLGELNQGFMEALKAGAYKTRSISLFADNTIRHLGFLGGVQPAVPGLGPFKFADNQEQYEYEMAEVPPEELARENAWFKKLFTMFKLDVSAAANINPPVSGQGVEPMSDELKLAQEQIATLTKSAADFAAKLDELTKENSALKITITAHDAERVKAADETRRAEYKTFADGLVASGQLLPASVEQVLENLDLRYEKDSKASDFAQSKAVPSVDKYRATLQAAPKVMEFTEVATKGTAAGHVPGDSETKISTWIGEKLAANKGMSFAEANIAVSTEHPAEYADYLAQMQ